MNDIESQVKQLMDKATGMSDADVALLDQAARLADQHGDVALGLRARVKLITAANWAGNHEMVLVAFTWCLAQIDRSEELRARFGRSVLWRYKWVIGSLSEYAQISRVQIERGIADMTERFTRAGYNMGAVHKCLANASIRLGDMESHRAARERWSTSPRDTISDCIACESNAAVKFDLEAGDLDAALRAAQPIIAGRQRCTSVPAATFGPLLLPLLRRGDDELAALLHYRTIRRVLSSSEVDTLGDHVAYLAVIGQFPKAIKAFETGMAWTMALRRTWDRMLFLQGAAVAFERLAATRNDPCRLKIPESAPFHRADDTYAPADVARALDRMTGELTVEFDRRNGNDYMTRRYERFRELAAAVPYRDSAADKADRR